jgi:hypothetical protein
VSEGFRRSSQHEPGMLRGSDIKRGYLVWCLVLGVAMPCHAMLEIRDGSHGSWFSWCVFGFLCFEFRARKEEGAKQSEIRGECYLPRFRKRVSLP